MDISLRIELDFEFRVAIYRDFYTLKVANDVV